MLRSFSFFTKFRFLIEPVNKTRVSSEIQDIPYLYVLQSVINFWSMNYSFLFNTSHVVIRDTATLSAVYFCHFFVYPRQFRHRTRPNQFEKPLEFGSKLVQYVLRKLLWLQLERKIRRDLYWRGESIPSWYWLEGPIILLLILHREKKKTKFILCLEMWLTTGCIVLHSNNLTPVKFFF